MPVKSFVFLLNLSTQINLILSIPAVHKDETLENSASLFRLAQYVSLFVHIVLKLHPTGTQRRSTNPLVER